MARKTRVLLAFPQPSVSSPQKSPPLSILHVGEALKRAKESGRSDDAYEVRYYDARWDTYPDMDWPDIVGVSAMTGVQLNGAIALLKDAKVHKKRTVLGGIHVSMQPEECLVEDYVDSIVIGQGEWAILDAIHGQERVTAVNLRTEDMVSPVSADTMRYFQYSAKTGDTMLLASRGCPYSCSFCFNVPFYHKKGQLRWSKVDLDVWKRDILYLKRETGLTRMAHGDDWIGPVDRLFEILEFLQEHGISYWPSIRAHQITRDVARQMKELGVEKLSIGIETASQRMLDLVNKGNDLDDLIRCTATLADEGIWPLYYYILGLPTETQEEINKTLDFADWAYKRFSGRVTQNFYAFIPLPGNPLWELVDKSQLPKTMEEWSGFSLNQTHNLQASNVYHIGGLTFHRGKGDKTGRNFPGLSRLLILPFELLAMMRWKRRFFFSFGLEKAAIEALLRWASGRVERHSGRKAGAIH